MDTKLWSKGYQLEPLIERFIAERNAVLDANLARYDVLGSLAHARMLCRVGLLDEHEWLALDATLRTLLSEIERGDLAPATADEDIHTLIERVLVERLGPTGKRIHTGRSRNDQVLVDLRLYAKESLLRIASKVVETAAALAAVAQRHEWTPMPGYTHMRRAMLSSVGLWAAAYTEALLDDLTALSAAYVLNDQSPLGSAAAYGVPLPLDRAYVARLLGFSRTHHNVLAAANARGKCEAAVVQALALVMLDLSKWAQDALLFTTSEYGFFTAPPELCDGSSIMPQKHNPSALELVRARAHTVVALQGQMLSTLAGLPSGYNMDYQETKAPLMDAVRICEDSLSVVQLFVERLHVHPERLRDACTAELFAADRAYELVSAGMPFRDAYQQAAAVPDALEPGDLRARLTARAHEGAPGNLGLADLRTRLGYERAIWDERRSHLDGALAALASGSPELSLSAIPDSSADLITSDSGNGFTHGSSVVLGI
ncbi:MAG TPA: argininosuccinate lyase [Ktedonobacterales bacterium]